MSLNARRHRPAPLFLSDAPKLPKVTREEADRLPLVDRVLLAEHQRHADRLAEIRRVADRLAPLAAIVQAAQADGASIDIARVRLSISHYRRMPSDTGRGVQAVTLSTGDTLSAWRQPKAQNAIANALLAAGWRVAYAYAEGSEVMLDRVIFMHGHRAVETTCMRQWVLEAIEAGHITSFTQGRHPATDTGTPLAASQEAHA